MCIYIYIYIYIQSEYIQLLHATQPPYIPEHIGPAVCNACERAVISCEGPQNRPKIIYPEGGPGNPFVPTIIYFPDTVYAFGNPHLRLNRLREQGLLFSPT